MSAGERDDVVVVGAGLGGLVLGAILARRGRHVTVIEQHYLAGGCATTFRRKGFRFEVSLHALDGLDELDPKIGIFRELGLLDELPLVHVPRNQFYRFKHPALDITLPGTIDGAARTLARAFPHERRAIAEFFATVSAIRADLGRLFLMGTRRRYGTLAARPLRHRRLLQYRKTTVGEYLDSLFEEELLKLVLVANILYYHDDPYELSLFWYCLSQGSFMSGGVHFVRGGSQVLSDHLAQQIRESGGEVLLGQTVEEILVERGRAVGVRYRKTLGRVRPEGTRHARVVVVNAPLPTAVTDLTSAPELDAYRSRVSGLRKSCSFLSIFLGLRVPPQALGNRVYSTILPGEGVGCMADLVREFRSREWFDKGFEFVDYSQIDHGLAPAGKSVAVISLVDYYSNWDGLSADEYRRQKDEVARILIAKLDRLVPGIAAAVEHYEVATPLTILRYTKNPDGCIYGFRQDVGQAVPFRLGPTCPVDNLYFASAWVTPGGGFSGAMLAGLNCARQVERRLSAGREARSATPTRSLAPTTIRAS